MLKRKFYGVDPESFVGYDVIEGKIVTIKDAKSSNYISGEIEFKNLIETVDTIKILEDGTLVGVKGNFDVKVLYDINNNKIYTNKNKLEDVPEELRSIYKDFINGVIKIMPRYDFIRYMIASIVIEDEKFISSKILERIGENIYRVESKEQEVKIEELIKPLVKTKYFYIIKINYDKYIAIPTINFIKEYICCAYSLNEIVGFGESVYEAVTNLTTPFIKNGYTFVTIDDQNNSGITELVYDPTKDVVIKPLYTKYDCVYNHDGTYTILLSRPMIKVNTIRCSKNADFIVSTLNRQSDFTAVESYTVENGEVNDFSILAMKENSNNIRFFSYSYYNENTLSNILKNDKHILNGNYFEKPRTLFPYNFPIIIKNNRYMTYQKLTPISDYVYVYETIDTLVELNIKETIKQAGLEVIKETDNYIILINPKNLNLEIIAKPQLIKKYFRKQTFIFSEIEYEHSIYNLANSKEEIDSLEGLLINKLTTAKLDEITLEKAIQELKKHNDIIFTIRDSIIAGNCKHGTMKFIDEAGIKKKEISLDELVNLINKHKQYRIPIEKVIKNKAVKYII